MASEAAAFQFLSIAAHRSIQKVHQSLTTKLVTRRRKLSQVRMLLQQHAIVPARKDNTATLATLPLGTRLLTHETESSPDVSTTASSDDLLPVDLPDQVYVKLSAIEAGWIHLPEREFIDPHRSEAVHRCLSLAFIIQHPSTNTKVVYDLGLRKDISNYPAKIARYLQDGSRTVEIPTDVGESLKAGGISPSEVDFVILSLLHYDHTGNPDLFPNSRFIIGPGSLDLLAANAAGDPEDTWFLPTLLPSDTSRITEFPDPHSKDSPWRPLARFPFALDLFSDGSFYIINAPGHVEGHINGLARIGPDRWVLLGSDSCHFSSLLDGSCCIAQFSRPDGSMRSVHVDDDAAARHIQHMRETRDMAGGRVEVVLAHDLERCSKNRDRFLPGRF